MRTQNLAVVVLIGTFVAVSKAETLSIISTKAAGLYEASAGTLANGAGNYFFAGLTNQPPGFNARRGLVQFDLSTVPAGATINNATVSLWLSRSADPLPFVFNLHFNNAGDIYSPPDAPIIKLRESLFKEFPNDEALIEEHNPGVDIIECAHRPQYLQKFGAPAEAPGAREPLTFLKGRRVFAFSGIATPEIPIASAPEGYDLPVNVDVLDNAGDQVFRTC